MSRRTQLACVWCGPALTVIFVIGVIVLGDFIPPPTPNHSAEYFQEVYTDNKTGIRLGMVIAIFSMAMIAPFGAALITQIRRIKLGSPVLIYTQIACLAVGTLVAVLFGMVWGLAAFRPEDTDPDVTRMLHDFGWFLVLFDPQPFTIWFFATGVAILQDKRAEPIFPRWAAYLNFWMGLMIIPAVLIVFFKSGPFGYSGLISCYVPLGAFFAWVCSMTYVTIKAINKEAEEAQALEAAASAEIPEPAAV